MHSGNIYSLFQSRFPSAPHRIFLEHERGQLLYQDLDSETEKVVGLLDNLGISKGERVIMQVDKSPEAVTFYLGCLRAGVIFIPLNTAYTPAEVAYFIEDAKPSLIVCSSDSETLLEPHIPRITNLLTLDKDGQGTLTEQLALVSPSQRVEPCLEDDLACILYTSGTTGRSKGAMLSHQNLASNAQTLHEYWQWQDGDTLLHALPIFHIHGLFVALHCALMNGSRVHFLSKFDPTTIIKKLPDTTVMMGVPTFYVRLLEDPTFNREVCRNMRLFIAGSAPLLPETFNSFEERTGHKILERYGMTEAGMITSNPYDGERVPGTVGMPLPGVVCRVADDKGQALQHGQVGVLEVRGPNIFKGYWCMPEKTREEFRDDGYFITGDMATQNADGRISIVGRAKDLIISGGFNIYPKEVELVIDDIDGVKESAVIGVPHPDFGEGVTAVVVLEPNANISKAGIIYFLVSQLAKFKQPKEVYFVDELPRNAMGKVQKKALREQYKNTFNQ